ncbi:MAG: NACHT domain-containing protein, partial [Cyanobium sp.]
MDLAFGRLGQAAHDLAQAPRSWSSSQEDPKIVVSIEIRGERSVLEAVAATTALELGKLFLDQLQDLGKSAMEDYVKDFFKDSIKAGVSKANAAILKQPMTEAIGLFVKRFVRELEINEVHTSSIDHFYRGALRRYVKDQQLRPILGQAFEKDRQQIDWPVLKRIWMETNLEPGWRFPTEDFNWQAVCKEYQFEVKGLIRTNPELREILSIELAEDVAANTKAIASAAQQLAGPSVGFDLRRYRESILEQYAHLPLESLGSGMYEREGLSYRNIPLWNIFVAQDVRACQSFLPKDFELPKDIQHRFSRAPGRAPQDPAQDGQELAMRFQDYGRQPKQSVRAILGWDGLPEFNPTPEHKHLVILGDPGSGKSSLLRYLAVRWAQHSDTSHIPLLIELRQYIRSKQGDECKDFLDFVHRGSQWVGHLDQLELVSWLEQGKVILLLDGLDEIVDRPLRGMVIKQIHSFTQRFSAITILITSRVHDYGSAIQELSHAGFFHYRLEDLDLGQIKDFLERWHEATYGPGIEKYHKRERLLAAIGRSKAIQELAANPLLLTLMAILNRAQELPRDRTHLYEKASEVLLHQWDVEAKLLHSLKLKSYPIEISFRDKRAMLRRVAFAMQNSNKGLAGNVISHDALHACLKEFLQQVKEAPNAPSIADLMIEQLRERNFVLCFLGGDQYGFVHRTFLEYYCASEITYRFEQQHSLDFDELRDHVFGKH